MLDFAYLVAYRLSVLIYRYELNVTARSLSPPTPWFAISWDIISTFLEWLI